jgi:hypothetical protein
MIRDKSAVAVGMMLTVCAGSASCVSHSPYNPDRLDSTQVSTVANICRTVMRLDPSEPPVANLWPGDPDPAATTNDYRGCVASLSNSLRSSATARLEVQADEDCRSKGLRPNSSRFAACVLKMSQAQSAQHVPQAQYADLVVTPETATLGDPDLSVPEVLRRERLACARIGLDPTGISFAGCVHGLHDVLSASEMDADYEN